MLNTLHPSDLLFQVLYLGQQISCHICEIEKINIHLDFLLLNWVQSPTLYLGAESRNAPKCV